MTEPRTPPTRGIRHIALNVRDLSRMEMFYVDILGYTVEWRPNDHEVYLTHGEDNLALHRFPHASLVSATIQPMDEPTDELADKVSPPEPTALNHLGLLVDCAEDVATWGSYLAKRGVRLDAAPRTHRDGATSLYLSDPEGNRIQIIHHPPLAKKSPKSSRSHCSRCSTALDDCP
ncbi:MAG: VOC family protein [Polyangiales bacterium]